MRPAELASLVSSCAYLGARPDDATLASLFRDLQNMYSDASGDDLANFAMAMAQFRYTPSCVAPSARAGTARTGAGGAPVGPAAPADRVPSRACAAGV
jgi:hypothetical protein